MGGIDAGSMAVWRRSGATGLGIGGQLYQLQNSAVRAKGLGEGE